MRCPSPPRYSQAGFTLVELMIVVVVVAILAAIALPGYQNFIKKSRAKTAGADLISLSAAVENDFQRKLKYSTVENVTQFTTWQATQGDFFDYSYTPPTSGTQIYTLKATGKGSMNTCDLTLKNDNTRTITGDCGSLTSW